VVGFQPDQATGTMALCRLDHMDGVGYNTNNSYVFIRCP